MCIGPSEYSIPVICNDFPLSFNEDDYFKVGFRIFNLNKLIIKQIISNLVILVIQINAC